MKLVKGDLVKVLCVADARDVLGEHRFSGKGRAQEVLPALKFVGRVGRIVDVKTGGPMAVGNTPIDPLYVVRVPLLGQDGFWSEELEKLAG